ncbi:MAG: DUF2752 domain-containing protein [Actinomyces sp.]|uniref:DUF2752 domain-containing protein n=1 Tax=Actinomyces sp. TaxID=29317 RepID=UPI0026DAC7DC|nr:DUF2752 domain-containing protein [Actinomyces sp.]MDO4243872.1 DUF2752 domain-containing protein [Actinomyces sp.]
MPCVVLLGSQVLGGGVPAGPDLCPVHRLTGYWCPLCGGTRATHALVHGDLHTAVGYNPFALLLLVAGGALVARWLLRRVRGRPRPLLTGLVTGREVAVLAGAAALFAVVRNMPGMWVHLGPLLGPPG